MKEYNNKNFPDIDDKILKRYNRYINHFLSIAKEKNIVYDDNDEMFENYVKNGIVEVPYFVETLPKNFFSWDENLKKVKFNEGLKILADCVFDGTNIESAELPESLEKIGAYCFAYCYNLTRVKLPKNLLSMGEGIFENSDSLDNIIFPEGITSIPDYTFYGCENLKNITLPKCIKKIGKNAFKNCISLELTISDKIEIKGKTVFKNCKKINITRE